jgi:hypothetical protein
LFQNPDERIVVWLGASFAPGRNEYLKGLALHLQIGLDVEVGRVGAFMPEPQGDNLWGDSTLEQVHGGTVSESMWRDAALAE